MEIAFFGSSLLSTYWNGAATYYRGIIRALSERGHRVTFYEPDAYDRQRHRDMTEPRWARVVVYPAEEAAALAMLERARRADVLVKCSGVGVFDDLLEAALPQAAGPRTLSVFWDVDAPATLERVEGNPEDPLRRCLGGYDLVLTYGGGDRVVAAYRRFGAPVCVPVYNALDPTTHHPVPPAARFAAELGFLGNRLPDREARVEQFLFRAAERRPDSRFLLGGSGWADKPRPRNLDYVGHVGSADHNAFNCSCRAVLNVNRDSMASYGFSPPTRVFEAAGAGACLITDRWPGIEAFLEPETEILVATDGIAVAAALDRLDPARAAAIGAAARRRVLAHHTYAQRAALVEHTLATGACSPEAV